MKRKLLAFLMSVIIILALCSCDITVEKSDSITPVANLNGVLNVHFIDVGQGDCTLLESNGKFMLIDAGEKEYEDIVCEYLTAYDVKTIEYVIATHPHSDHCGSLTKVIDTFDCKNFITTQTDQQTQVWLDVLSAVDKNDVNYIDAEVGSTYTLGETKIEILGPVGTAYDNYNDYSVVVKATCYDASFLFTGDAETLSEYEMIENGANLSADVLKVGHHGSYTSTSSRFLNEVNPSYAVISCGLQNDYGHPHKEVTKRLADKGVVTYRTDTNHTVIASYDKQNITFYYDDTTSAPNTSPSQSQTSHEYVGNKNSKKFHLPDCGGAVNTKDENKIYFDSRKQAIDDGYSPCQSCNP